MQDFVHELPLKEYAKINFGESLVSAKTSQVLGYTCSAVKIEKLSLRSKIWAAESGLIWALNV